MSDLVGNSPTHVLSCRGSLLLVVVAVVVLKTVSTAII